MSWQSANSRVIAQIVTSAVFAACAMASLTMCLADTASSASSAERRWRIQFLENDTWIDSDTFDARQVAQDKLDARRAKTAATKPLVGRVVPADWSKWQDLGALSAKYESGSRASATVSSGNGDPGGVSYGKYQLSSKAGTTRKFVKEYFSEWFGDTEPGSEEFSALWKKLAAEREPELAVYEHLYIAETHYEPFARRLKSDLGLDLDQRSPTLRDVAWSTAVQHGAGNKIFHRALQPAVDEQKLNQLSDADIIALVYRERGRVDGSGKMAYFSKSSPRVQESVLKRFKNESRDALKELEAESQPPAVQSR